MPPDPAARVLAAALSRVLFSLTSSSSLASPLIFSLSFSFDVLCRRPPPCAHSWPAPPRDPAAAGPVAAALSGARLRSPPAAAACGCKGCGLQVRLGASLGPTRAPPPSTSSPAGSDLPCLRCALSLSLSLFLTVSLTPAEPTTSSSAGGTGVLRCGFGAGPWVALFFIFIEILSVSALCMHDTHGVSDQARAGWPFFTSVCWAEIKKHVLKKNI